jgi:quercetin dioxygenase-like cupin family protein
MTSAVPIIKQAGEGEQLWFAGGGLWTLKATSAETAEAFMLFEFRAERGKVTPLHLHPNEDEGFYVLDGEILVHLAGEEHLIGEGGVFIAPRGVAHAFMVTSETARLLCWQTPGTGEAFYREVTEPIESPDDVSRPPDWARLRGAAERSSAIELLGPPPFAPAHEEAAAAPA